MSEFKTKQQREIAIANYKNLLDSPGWIMYAEGIEENIELVTKGILKGGQPEAVMDGLRLKLQAYKEDLSAPKDMIKKLQDAKGEEPDLDPFE